MSKRNIKFFSLILSLILVLVSVPTVAFSEEISSDDISEEITTEFQSDLSITELQTEEITDVGDFNSVNSESDRSTTVSYEQITTFPDGIYAFENLVYPDHYMRCRSATEGQTLLRSRCANSPAIQNLTAGLFKVIKLSGSNNYVIRSMLNLDNAIFVDTDGSVTTKDVGSTNINLPSGCIFGISLINGAYVIYNTSSLYCITADTTNSTLTSVSISDMWDMNETRWIPRAYRTFIEDGVYAFANIGNSGFWMDTQHDSYLSGKHAQQYAYTSCPTESFSRGGLFKITETEIEGQYIIRLMTNNLLTWTINSANDVLSTFIPSDEEAIGYNKRYYIVYDKTGFMFVPCNDINKVISAKSQTNASGNSGAPDSYLCAKSRSDVGDIARWTLYKYTGDTRHGADLIIPDEIEDTGAVVGETYTVTPIVWHTGPNINRYNIVESGKVASITKDTVNHTTTVDVDYAGDLTLRVSMHHMLLGVPVAVTWDNFYYNAIPEEGTYYIRNSYSQKFANVRGPSYIEGTILHQSSYSSEDHFKWEIEHVMNSGGYVRFKSAYSGQYIGADPDNPVLICQYSTTDDSTLWRFELLDNYSVKIICKASEDSDQVLAVLPDAFYEGAGLLQYTYTDDDMPTDEWIISQHRYQYHIDHYYDIGYSVRFSEINPNVDELISSYQDYVSEFFAATFDVEIKFTCQQYTSPADICAISQYGSVNANNLISNCPHPHTNPNNTDPLHTTRTALKESLSTGDNTKSIAIWTGHILDGNPGSVAFDYTVVMTPHHTTTGSTNGYANKPQDKVYYHSILSLMHELSHQIGAKDHYCKKGINDEGPCSNMNCDTCHNGYVETRKCIMADGDDLLFTDNELYCSECITKILTHLNKHH